MIKMSVYTGCLAFFLPSIVTTTYADDYYKCIKENGDLIYAYGGCPDDTASYENLGQLQTNKNEYSSSDIEYSQVEPSASNDQNDAYQHMLHELVIIENSVKESRGIRERRRQQKAAIKRAERQKRQNQVDELYYRLDRAERRAYQAENNARSAGASANDANAAAQRANQQMRINEQRARSRQVERNIWGNNLW